MFGVFLAVCLIMRVSQLALLWRKRGRCMLHFCDHGNRKAIPNLISS